MASDRSIRWIGAAIALVLTAAPLNAAAQQPARVARIGYLIDGRGGPDPNWTKFEGGLREHGYVHGTNFVVERRPAEGRPERLPDLAAELARLRVDLIVAPSERGAAAARQATTAIPIVMVLGVDPVGRGLIDSLARPGGNVTGLTADPGPEIIAKRLQYARDIVPAARTIALLTEPSPETEARYKPLEDAARASGVSLVRADVRRTADLAGAFGAMNKARAGAIIVSGATVLYLSRHEVAELALKHRLAAVYPLGAYVEAGGLLSYGVDMLDLFRRAGGYAGRILNGAKPADLPVEQPTKFELVINLKTAKSLGLTIPPPLLLRADRLIE